MGPSERLMGVLLVPPFWRSDASVGLLRPHEKRQQGIAGSHCRIQRSLEEIANPCPISSPLASSVEGCSLPLFLGRSPSRRSPRRGGRLSARSTRSRPQTPLTAIRKIPLYFPT